MTYKGKAAYAAGNCLSNDIEDYDDLGRYYIDELEVMQVPEHLQNYIDYEAYGRDIALEESGQFPSSGSSSPTR